MADYFTEFWLIATDGRKLFPARIQNKDTGVATYRTRAKGDNTKAGGREYHDPIDAIRAFLAGASLTVGAPNHPANRFDLKGPKTAKVDASPAFRAANPTLIF